MAHDFCPMDKKHCMRNCRGFECKRREEEKEEQRARALYPTDRGTNLKDLLAYYGGNGPMSHEVAVIGDYVEKFGGSYNAKGFLRSIFTNEAGDLRAVFEFESHAGMLHIYNFGQLRLIRRRL